MLEDLRPLLGQVDPALRQLNPILDYLGLYKRELTAFFANTVAATQATTVSDKGPLHYLRTTNPLNPENLAVYPTRLPTNRPNPYTLPGHFDQLRTACRPTRRATATAGRCRRSPTRRSRSAAGHCRELSLPVRSRPPVPDAGRRRRPVLLLRTSCSRTSCGSPSRAAQGRPGVAPPCTQQAPFDVARRAVRSTRTSSRGRRRCAADGLQRVVRAAARRPRAGARRRSRCCARGRAALALGLQPSAATSTLAGRSSDTYQATERYRERFGDHAIVVLVRGPLQQLVLTENLGRLLGLEGCLSGNRPAGQAAPGGERGPCAELARTKPVQVVYGPGTFINSAVGEIQDQLKRAARRQGRRGGAGGRGGARGSRGARASRRPSRSALARSAEQLVYAQFVRDLLQLNLKYGLGVDETPRLDDPDFVSTLVFDPSRGATTPKARFAYLFPSSESAAIQVRLKPGLSRRASASGRPRSCARRCGCRTSRCATRRATR